MEHFDLIVLDMERCSHGGTQYFQCKRISLFQKLCCRSGPGVGLRLPPLLPWRRIVLPASCLLAPKGWIVVV